VVLLLLFFLNILTAYQQDKCNIFFINYKKINMSFLSKLIGSSASSNHIKVLGIEAFKLGIASNGTQLIDVRTASEFKSGAIANAKNINFFNRPAMETAFKKLDPTKPVYLYCRSGNRSGKAANLLVKMGFTEIYDLKGGYTSWR
jgi:rhodanese-related sulfurtransferase